MSIATEQIPSFTGADMGSLKIIVPTIPVAQPRQRHRVIQSGGRAFASNYTPKADPSNAYKAAIQLALANVYQGPPLDCPVVLSMTFVFPRVKPTWLKKGMAWFEVWKIGKRIPHTKKPDRDNVMKSTQDALNGLLFRDDSLAYRGTVEKWLAAEDEQPHVLIVAEW